MVRDTAMRPTDVVCIPESLAQSKREGRLARADRTSGV